MQSIVLITGRNTDINEQLASSFSVDYQITPEQCKPQNDAFTRAFASGDVFLVEDVTGDKFSMIMESWKHNDRKGRLIFSVRDIDPSRKKRFLSHGISEILLNKPVEEIATYIQGTSVKPPGTFGKIVLLDSDEMQNQVISRIISSFHLDVVKAKDIDELIELSHGNGIEMVLMNIGGYKVNVQEFIRKTYADTVFKSIPFIPYKANLDDVFIHEILSGLHRLSLVVLSAEELYSFLVSTLFRKVFLTPLYRLKNVTSAAGTPQFARESLRQLYHSIGYDLFTMDHICGEEHCRQYRGYVHELEYAMNVVDGFKWLLLEKKDCPTFERDV